MNLEQISNWTDIENIDQKVILGSIFILLGIGLTNIFVPKKLLRD